MKPDRFLALALLGFLLSACGGIAPSPAPEELKHVSLTMGYRPDVQFAPMYVMDALGFDAEQGLDVEFQHLPETEAVQLVGVGEIPFAIVSGEQVLLARSQGLPVVYVMAWWQDYPVAIAARSSLGIESPADLVGKRVGLPGLFGASYIGYQALMEAAGVPLDQVQLDSIGYTQVEALSQGLEDAVVVYANNEPIQLENLGIEVNVFRVADYVHLASNGLITSEQMIEDHPDLVRSMVAAFLSGLDATIADPDMAFQVAGDYVDGLREANQDVQREVLRTSIEFWLSDRPGYSQPEAWNNMQQVLLGMGLLESPLALNEAFTNQLLPEAGP
ncbi:MAG: ABC transporter substrate-binding protein [Anaerolineales bacterium]|jgi:NitT/TauT family transport system substrate-binding protein